MTPSPAEVEAASNCNHAHADDCGCRKIVVAALRAAREEIVVTNEKLSRMTVLFFASSPNPELFRDKEQAEWRVKELELEKSKTGWTYPHMCRDGHPQIGHSTDGERCPVCIERDASCQEVERLKTALEEVQTTIESGARGHDCAGYHCGGCGANHALGIIESVLSPTPPPKDDAK